MHNTPFRFLNSPMLRELLRQTLGQVGLSEQKAAEQETADEEAIDIQEKLIPLEEAIRRLTSLPATNLGLKRRGSLVEG